MLQSNFYLKMHHYTGKQSLMICLRLAHEFSLRYQSFQCLSYQQELNEEHQASPAHDLDVD